MNICLFSGYIGNEIQLKKTQEGMSVLNFRLGVRRNSNETDWLQCTAFKEKAEFISKYFKKGSFIEVRTRARTSSSEKDGKRTYYTNYDIQEVEFGGAKKDEHPSDQHEPTAPSEDEPEFDIGQPLDISELDLPF